MGDKIQIKNTKLDHSPVTLASRHEKKSESRFFWLNPWVVTIVGGVVVAVLLKIIYGE